MEQIKFINILNVDEDYRPTPAHNNIPDWYKELDSYVGKEKSAIDGVTTGTIKRCMPIFDSITSGYIIYSHVDIFISQKDGAPYYQWPQFEAIGFHPIVQAPTLPYNTGHTVSYPKWINSWGIKTPKGYSTLFITPTYRDLPFTILPGVVDTDTYMSPVNFPFVLNDVNYTGIIRAGTPIAQAIPFKRTSWKMSIDNSLKTHQLIQKDFTKLRSSIFDSYKTRFRQVKEYK